RADGKSVVGGDFNTFLGQPRTNLVRLLPDGSLDPTFTPTASGTGALVASLAIQADRSILVGGSFSSLNGQPWPILGRLFPDGALDATFHSIGAATLSMASLGIQADGKILAASQFDSLAGQSMKDLGRLNSNG